jgi:hypothetical protein
MGDVIERSIYTRTYENLGTIGSKVLYVLG